MINLDSKIDKTIVGFNTGHNGGCTVIHNNKLISIAEERLNRKKYSENYLYSLIYCLEELGLNINDVDLFVSSCYGNRLENGYMGKLKRNPESYRLSSRKMEKSLFGKARICLQVLFGWKSRKMENTGSR